MKYAALLAVVPLCVLLSATVSAQEKGDDQLRKELTELQAKVKALEAEIAKLKGEANKLVPGISDQDKKWVRNLTADFMSVMLKGGHDLRKPDVKPFVGEGWTSPDVEDPNVKVKHNRLVSGMRIEGGYEGFRRVELDFVFEKYEIESEEVSPSKEEVVIRGKLSGNKQWSKSEQFNKGSLFFSTQTTEGALGERTGPFMLRISKERGANRWAITYLTWSVDEIKKDTEKK